MAGLHRLATWWLGLCSWPRWPGSPWICPCQSQNYSTFNILCKGSSRTSGSLTQITCFWNFASPHLSALRVCLHLCCVPCDDSSGPRYHTRHWSVWTKIQWSTSSRDCKMFSEGTDFRMSSVFIVFVIFCWSLVPESHPIGLRSWMHTASLTQSHTSLCKHCRGSLTGTKWFNWSGGFSMWIQVHVIDSSTGCQQLLKCLREKMQIGHGFICSNRSCCFAFASWWTLGKLWSSNFLQHIADSLRKIAAAFLVNMAIQAASINTCCRRQRVFHKICINTSSKYHRYPLFGMNCVPRSWVHGRCWHRYICINVHSRPRQQSAARDCGQIVV